MPESMNVEVAHKLGEHEQVETTKRREHWETFVEVIEVFVLAVVAVATAWGGYQATKWDGRQSFLYGKASSVRFQADAASTFGGQELAGDVEFNAWLQAHSASDTQLESQFRAASPQLRDGFQRLAEDRPLHEPEGSRRPRHDAPVPQSLFRQGHGAQQPGIGDVRRGHLCQRYSRQVCTRYGPFRHHPVLVAVAQRMKSEEHASE